MVKWLREKLTPADKKPTSMTAQKLTDVTRGMHHAASSTSALLAEQYIQLLNQFFDPEEDGTLKAKMVRIDVDAKHYMLVPLVSLVAPKGLALNKLAVSMSVKMSQAEARHATSAADSSKATRSSFEVTLSPQVKNEGERRSSEIIDIDMEFLAGEPPEGVMRAIEEFTNKIQPIPKPTTMIDPKTGEEKELPLEDYEENLVNFGGVRDESTEED